MIKPKRQKFLAIKTTFSYPPYLKGKVLIDTHKGETLEVDGEDILVFIIHVLKELLSQTVTELLEEWDVLDLIRRKSGE